MKMFIVLDSNMWISQVGLQSQNGAAVRHFVKRRKAIMVIPEVVELEVRYVLTEQMLGKRKAVETNYRQLLPIMGSLRTLDLPSEDDIRDAVAARILNLDVPTRRVSLNLDVSRASMLKVIEKHSPSKSKEQFRDGVIWGHCLDLLDEGNVYLITKDKDFYERRNYNEGLASELVDEMRARGTRGEVKLLRDLTDLLQEIRVTVNLDDGEIFQVVRDGQGETIDELLVAHGFGLVGEVRGEVQYFATEKASEIYFRFQFSHPCEDVIGAGRRAGVLNLKGFGFLDLDTKMAIEVSLSNLLLDYPDWVADGSSRGAVFLSAHVNAPLVHEIRLPLSTAKGKEDEPQ
ncbi:MAG: PIN domain-containing protein [Gemmatimonadota bacterium]|nr:PIN domain-containing protein [Gemmatimonadota bacterium]